MKEISPLQKTKWKGGTNNSNRLNMDDLYVRFYPWNDPKKSDL
jgi:hypothetical protein